MRGCTEKINLPELNPLFYATAIVLIGEPSKKKDRKAKMADQHREKSSCNKEGPLTGQISRTGIILVTKRNGSCSAVT